MWFGFNLEMADSCLSGDGLPEFFFTDNICNEAHNTFLFYQFCRNLDKHRPIERPG